MELMELSDVWRKQHLTNLTEKNLTSYMEDYGRIKALISEREKELHQKRNVIKVHLWASAVKVTYLLQIQMMDFTKIVL